LTLKINIEASLYIHVPFCASFCDYCDFYSVVMNPSPKTAAVMDSYIDAVLADIQYQIDFFHVEKIPTVYIGGGTPSLLGAERIRRLLNAVKKIAGFSPIEFTIEANPESAAEEFLSVCRDYGVNRISLGVQSFHEPSRRAVNRCGNAGIIEEKLALVSHYFPGAFSADIITGLPLQTKEILLQDIDRLLAYKPAHVSLYSLTVEQETPLYEKLKSRAISLPDRDESDALWFAGRDALIQAGYEHYEVSNFALGGKRCIHNIRYWRMENWLGIGPAACGTVINEENGTAKRFSYPANLEAYLNAPQNVLRGAMPHAPHLDAPPPLINMANCEELNKTELIRDSLLMGFRYCGGPDPQSFRRRFKCSIDECIPKTIERWKGRNIMLFLNSFLHEAFLEMESTLPVD